MVESGLLYTAKMFVGILLGISGEISKLITERFVGGIPAGISVGTLGGTLGGIPGGFPWGISGRFFGKKNPEGTHTEHSGRISISLPKKHGDWVVTWLRE